MKIDLLTIDKIRQKGYRPEVVGCFLKSKKLMFVYKREHELWQLPQGGIDNHEPLLQALQREMHEELGRKLIQAVYGKPELVCTHRIIFPEQLQNTRDLMTDDQKAVHMKGKYYFVFALRLPRTKITIAKKEFDGVRWLDFLQSLDFKEKIYQPQKKKMVEKILLRLRGKGLL